jgi:glutamate dehydrogenase (NAD(P)+)
VPIQKITGPDGSEMTGFVIVDLNDATGADGVVRCAKKILMDGARTMARSRTYSWALLEQRRSGASAAINVAPEHRAEGIAAFVEAVTPRVAAGEVSLDAAKGLGPAELAALDEVDRRSPQHAAPAGRATLAEDLTALGAVTAAAAALDGLDGATVALEGAGRLGPVLVDHLVRAGARVVGIGTATGTLSDPAGLDPEALIADWTEHGDALPAARGSELPADEILRTGADVLMCGSKAGLVDHEVATSMSVRVLAPIGVAPVTAKGLAVASRGGVVVLPDFLTLSGGLHSFVAAPEDTAATLSDAVRTSCAALTERSLAHAEGAYLGACIAAEEFLSSWQAELPFGRPLA